MKKQPGKGPINQHKNLAMTGKVDKKSTRPSSAGAVTKDYRSKKM